MARPVLAPIVATEIFVETHVEFVVTFFVLPSLYVPVAENCCVEPAEIDALDGVTEIEVSVGAGEPA